MASKTFLSVVPPATPEQRFSEYLAGLDDDKLACKAGTHNIPKLKPGRLPEGVDVRRFGSQGQFQITLACEDCGLPATLTTGNHGVLGPESRWVYDYAALPGFLAPKGTGRVGRKADYRVELGQRLAADVINAAAVTASRDAAAKRVEAARRAAVTPRQVHRRPNAHATNPRARKNTRDGERKMHAERQQRGGQL